MKIFNAKVVLGGFVLIFVYSFWLGPRLAFYQRNKSYDLFNVVHPNDNITVKVGYSTSSTPEKMKVLLSNSSVLYVSRNRVFKSVVTIPIPSSVASNESDIYVHAVADISQKGSSVDPLITSIRLIHWYIPSNQAPHKLMSNATEQIDTTPIPYIFRTCRFNLLYRDEPMNPQIFLPIEGQYIKFNQQQKIFVPPLMADTFFDIPSERRRVNFSNPTINVSIEFTIQSYTIWSNKLLYGFITSQNSMLEYQFNYFKRVFLENSATMLWSTGILTALQAIFQTLAFERDIQYWRSKSSFKGVSMRSIALQFLGSVISYMYLADSDIPLLVRIVRLANIGLNIWKLFKLIKVTWRWPFIQIREQYKGDTNEADIAGMKVLYIVTAPLVIGYAIYQLFNSEFTSVKSYILQCATGAMYSFGFLQMLPQLYVNYKMKSVAGMSLSAFVYKLINTFIDDFYAFLSNLPLMEKLAVFRDDFVFLIWLAQYFIYPTDPERVNEFGLQMVKDGENKEGEKKEEEKKIKTD